MNFKPIFNKGERAVFEIAQVTASELGNEVFAKVRVADILPIKFGRISDELYSYALKAHFDFVISHDNIPTMAIEFDGSGHDPHNDKKKGQICDKFEFPLVRVTNHHLKSSNFEDNAVSFLMHQLGCVDHFLDKYGNDPYEPFDPAFYLAVPGKTRSFPFAYSLRWWNRLGKRLKNVSERFSTSYRDFIGYGMVNLAAFEAAYIKDRMQFRSLSGLHITEDRALWGVAELKFQVHGLVGRRRDLFLELETFVDGLAAQVLFEEGIRFAESPTAIGEPVHEAEEILRQWESEGYLLRRGWNIKPIQRVTSNH
jgi:Protein of unknown function (DUF2726)